MPSTFTTNKNIEQPASGSYNDAWAAPVNADWSDIDNAFGGNVSVAITGATTVLTTNQYQPPNIIFTGTLTAQSAVFLPPGVGGVWTFFNNTTGIFPLILLNNVGGGDQVVLPPGRALVVSDGTNCDFADPNTVPHAYLPTSPVVLSSTSPVTALNAARWFNSGNYELRFAGSAVGNFGFTCSIGGSATFSLLNAGFVFAATNTGAYAALGANSPGGFTLTIPQAQGNGASWEYRVPINISVGGSINIQAATASAGGNTTLATGSRLFIMAL